jgi:hypothetical protein
MKLSQSEKDLIDAIREVRFGEIYGVEIPIEAAGLDVTINDACVWLIGEIREGLTDISVLTVHDGRPVTAETDFKFRNLCCRKKYKYNPTI